MFLILLLVSFSPAVLGYPIGTVLSSGSAYTATFASFLAVGVSLIVLILAKFLYMRYRRLQISSNFSDCSLQSSQMASAPIFYKTEKLAKPGKAAFLVGFFGSPSWETSVKTLYDGPSIYSNQLQFQSRRSQKLGRRTSRFSITEFGGLGRSSRYSDGSRAFSNTLVATSGLPPSYTLLAYPTNARTNSSIRRHSLPVTRQVHAEHIDDRRRRYSSLKSSRSHRSDHILLPKSFLDFTPPSSPNLSSISKSRSDCPCIPPLPPLPPSVLLSPLPNISGSPPAEGRSSISYPYALSPRIKHDLLNNSPSDFPPPDDIKSDEETAISPTTLPRVKPKPSRSPSIRSRKSPPIGPSPLRIVTIPEATQANLKTISQGNKQNAPIASAPGKKPEEPLEKKHNYANLGIGYPSSWGPGLEFEDGGTQSAEIEKESTMKSRRTSQSQSPHESSSRPSEEDDPDAIIQELVEETSQWDDSLFMDDSFKALIENSRSTSSSSSESSRHFRQSSPSGEDAVPPVPPPVAAPTCIANAESGRYRIRSTSSDVSARPNAILEPVSGTEHERKTSPKSILKKATMVPTSRSVEFELGLIGLDTVRMESFRMSAYDDSALYDFEAAMPGAYEHGMLLMPLPESNEEDEEQAQTVQGESHVGLAW